MANHPIFAPTFHGDVTAVEELLKDDPALITVRDAKNLTPLHVAASRGQSAVAQLLIDHGADVQGPTADGDWTPLVFAAYRGHAEVANILVENGAGVRVEDGNPIHYSGQRRHKAICKMLVEHGAIDDLIDTDDHDVLRLFRATFSYDSDSVVAVLTLRPELTDCRDKDGRTLLHHASMQGDTRTVRKLLKLGASATIQDSNGQTAADRATVHRQHAVVKLLNRHEAAG